MTTTRTSTDSAPAEKKSWQYSIHRVCNRHCATFPTVQEALCTASNFKPVKVACWYDAIDTVIKYNCKSSRRQNVTLRHWGIHRTDKASRQRTAHTLSTMTKSPLRPVIPPTRYALQSRKRDSIWQRTDCGYILESNCQKRNPKTWLIVSQTTRRLYLMDDLLLKWIYRKDTTGPTSSQICTSCSSVASYGMFPTVNIQRIQRSINIPGKLQRHNRSSDILKPHEREGPRLKPDTHRSYANTLRRSNS